MGADLKNADFRGARLDMARLSLAKNVDTIITDKFTSFVETIID